MFRSFISVLFTLGKKYISFRVNFLCETLLFFSEDEDDIPSKGIETKIKNSFRYLEFWTSLRRKKMKNCKNVFYYLFLSKKTFLSKNNCFGKKFLNKITIHTLFTCLHY